MTNPSDPDEILAARPLGRRLAEVTEHNRYSYVEPGSGGEDAIRREVEACIEEEEERLSRVVHRSPGLTIWDDPVIETTDTANEAFRAKLAYWREHGAPGYHGPRAVEKE